MKFSIKLCDSPLVTGSGFSFIFFNNVFQKKSKNTRFYVICEYPSQKSDIYSYSFIFEGVLGVKRSSERMKPELLDIEF